MFAFFGVNPSTADATTDDATVRKWLGFARRWGASRFLVGNVFPLRATHVRELAKWAMPVAVQWENDAHLRAVIGEADVLVPCWGDRAKVPAGLRLDLDAVLERLLASGKPVKHFGLTKGGDPGHPLMLGYSTPLQVWPVGLEPTPAAIKPPL